MKDLYLALGILAAVLLLVVYVYSKWQERRTLRRIDESVRGTVGDVLLEPKTGADRPGASARTGNRIEPTMGQLPDAPETGGTTTGGATTGGATTGGTPLKPSSWVEDPLLDCGLELHCAHAVDGVAVIDAAAPLARLALSLPVHLVALDGRTQQWVEPDRFGFYTELLAAVQLADRSRKLDEIEVSRFISAVQQLALTLDADFDPPDAPRILALAGELDRLCARFDVRIGLTLVPNAEPWKPAQVEDSVRHIGLTSVAPQLWQKSTADHRTLFTVSAPSMPIESLQFELDVPRVAPTEHPLRRMYETAAQLAIELNARIVDDNGRPVQSASIDAIGNQLDSLYNDMTTAGIEPGSTRARRLYN